MFQVTLAGYADYAGYILNLVTRHYTTLAIIIITCILLHVVRKLRQIPISFANGRITYNVTPNRNARSPPKHLYSCPLCLDIEGWSVGMRDFCLQLKVKRAAVWIALPDESDIVVTVWAEPSWWTMFMKQVVKRVIVFVVNRVAVCVEEGVLIRVASVGKTSVAPDRLYFLEIRVGKTNLSWRHRQEVPLVVESISLQLGCHTRTKMEMMQVVSIERVLLKKDGDESVLELGDQIMVNITAPFMMFIGSIVDRQAKKKVVGEKLFNPTNEPFTLRLPLPDLMARLRPIKQVTATIHIPVFDQELHCLDRAQLNMIDVSGQLFIRDMTPYFCLDVVRLALSARTLDVEERSGVTTSAADMLWGQHLEGEAELVVVESLCISDYGKTDFGVPVNQLTAFIDDLRRQQGPWWWRQRPDYDTHYKDKLAAISDSLQFDVDREDLGHSPYLLTILATMTSFRLYLPPEFPVGFLIDECVYIYKAALKGESWDVLSTAGIDFIVRFSAKEASLVFGDDEIDVAIGRVSNCKQALYDWVKQSGHCEDDHVGLFKQYQRICDEYSESHVDTDLLRIHGHDFVLQVQWKQEWSATTTGGTDGIAKILCGLSEEQELSVPMLSQMDTLMGGMLDASCNKLTVSFRDYGLPMLAAPRMRVHGLMFMLELLPEPQAVLRIPMTVYNGTDSSNLTRAAKGDSFVVKNTNPLKIFHCANILSHGNELTRIAFSPRWLPAFEQLDRAMEMFASPSADPSPILPIWDKVRFLLRGTYTAVTVTTPGQFDVVLGEDLRAVEDRLSIVLPMGTRLEQSPGGNICWDLYDALVTVNSRKLALLKYHLSSDGTDCFAKADKKDCRFLGMEQILLASLPKCRLQGSFKCLNADGVESVDHFAVHTVVREFADAGHDSFKAFRSDHLFLTLTIDIVTMVDKKVFKAIHYREMEEWLVSSLARIVDVPCKKGTLWRTAFIPQHRPFDIKRILKDVTLSARLHQQPLNLRLQSFHAVNEYSGINISASGFSISYHWRRWHNRYRTLLGQWDIVDGRIACFASCLNDHQYNVTSEYKVDIVKGVVGVEVLRAPVICSHSLNYRILNRRNDTVLLETRRVELDTLIAAAAAQDNPQLKRSCQSHLKHLLECLDNHNNNTDDQCAYTQYTAFDPNVSWDEDCREAVYSIFYQQTVREESKFARSNKMEKLLEEVMSFAVSAETRGDVVETVVDSGKPKSPKQSVTIEKILQALVEHAVEHKRPKVAEPDFVTGKAASAAAKLDLRSPKQLQTDYTIPSIMELQLVNAQVAMHVPLQSEDDAMPGRAVVLVVPEVVLQAGAVFPKLVGDNLNVDDAQFEYNRIGQRIKFAIDKAQMLVVPRSMTGPIFTHTSTSTTSTTTATMRITDQITIQGVCDLTWTAGAGASSTDPLYGPDRGDSIRVHCPSFAVRSKSADFTSVMALINRLLIYRDARVARRSTKKAAVFEEAIAGKTAKLAAMIRDQKQDCAVLQADLEVALSIGDECASLLQRIDDKLLELSVMAEAITAMRSEQQRLQPQSRLSINVILDEAAWTLLSGPDTRLAGVVLTGIREEWSSERDGSVASVFEIQSAVADGGTNPRHILEPLPPAIAHVTRIAVLPSGQSLLRFSFKATQARSVGASRSIEHAELVIAPMRLYLLQSQAHDLFRFFFPLAGTSAGGSMAGSAMAGTDQPTQPQTQEVQKKKEKIDFTVITVPASNHVLTFKPDNMQSDLATALIDTNDFVLRIPDLEYANEQCTWDDLALKFRNDLIVVLLRNAGKLIRQKFQSQRTVLVTGAGGGGGEGDSLRQYYHGEALPVASDASDDASDGDGDPSGGGWQRRERAERALREEHERKGRFLFGRYFHR